MSKLCQYCGAEMDNEALECPECLKKIPGADTIKKRKEAEKKDKQKKIIKIVTGSVLAVAFITGLVLLVTHFVRKPSDIYMKPVKKYINGCVANEYDEYISAFPEYLQQIISEQYAYLVMNEMPSTPEKVHTADLLYFDQYYRAIAQKYGTDFDITYKIYEEKPLTDEELEKYTGEFRSFDQQNLSDVSFSEGYELTVAFTVKGNLGSKTFTEKDFPVLKIDDTWYIMNYIDFFKEEEKTSLQNMN
jgi:hypothetical protein